MKLAEVLGTLPSGQPRSLSPDGLSRYLRENYDTEHESKRMAQAEKRLDLYKDRGLKHFEAAIDATHNHPSVKRRLKSFLSLAEYQNLTKRITREISTVYSEPARRKVTKGEQQKFNDFAKAVRLDRRMRQANRFTNLLRNVLVWPAHKDGRPVQRIVTPNKFRAISHPNDPLHLVGFIVDMPEHPHPDAPRYLVMGDEEFIKLNKDWRVVSAEPHSLGQLPALLLSADEPDECLLEMGPGADITAAHLAVALLNAMMFKHQKSGSKMAIATGDTSGMARGQAFDEETVIEAPEGVGFTTLDMGADPESYIQVLRNLLKQIAANYGIPESVFDMSYQATSGFEIELKRTGLREIRNDQILDYRPFEEDLAGLWSVVLKQSRSPFSFGVSKWAVDFGSTDLPLPPMDRLAYWEKLEGLDLMNREEMFMELNPEATRQEAKLAIAENRELRMDRMKDFQSENGGLFGSSEQGNDGNQGDDEDEDSDDELDAA